jgi:hypothetical protein
MKNNRPRRTRELKTRKEIVLNIEPIGTGNAVVIGRETIGGVEEKQGTGGYSSTVWGHLRDHVPDPKAQIGIRSLFAVLMMLLLLSLLSLFLQPSISLVPRHEPRADIKHLAHIYLMVPVVFKQYVVGGVGPTKCYE